MKIRFLVLTLLAVIAIGGISLAFAKPAWGASMPIKIETRATPAHIKLGTTNNILYILPPERSFGPDTTGTFFGLSSPQYPGVILRFIYSGVEYDDNDSLINLKYRLIKKIPLMRVNDYFNVWAYKVQPKQQPATHYIWLIFIDDDISYIQGTFSYPVANDRVLGANMEKLIKNIVNEPNPVLLPKHSVYCEGDYSIIGLRFVPQIMAPVAYFTEDAKPFKTTKHSRMFAVASPPFNNSDNKDKITIAIQSANQILSLSKLNDSVVVEQISETEINGSTGYRLRGSLQNNTAKRLVIYYADDLDDLHFLLLGICDAKDEEDFFEKIDKFRPTLKRHVY